MQNTPKAPTTLLIDTDTGVDDAIAILMALTDPYQVDTITAVSGNTDLLQVLRNIGQTLDVAGKDAPFYAGCDRPLLGDAARSGDYNGLDGLGNASASLPATSKTPEAGHGVLKIIERVHAFARAGETLTLVTLGPLTNLALAVRLDPQLPTLVSRLVCMGGAVEAHGNTTPTAEFNIHSDPEAAEIVFSAGFRDAWLLPWETVLNYSLPWDVYNEIIGRVHPRAHFLQAITEKLLPRLKMEFEQGLLLPDPLAMAVALDPQVVVEAPLAPVLVETAPGITRGMTVVDWEHRTGRNANVHVVTRIDSQRFIALLRKSME